MHRTIPCSTARPGTARAPTLGQRSRKPRRRLLVESLEPRLVLSGSTADQPFLAPIDNVTLLSGSPLHIPLDGSDPNGGPLTYRITDNSNPALVSTSVLQGNRSMRISVAKYGDMVFELFEDRADRATEHIIELAEDDYYDGIIFHRIIDGFMIQAGGFKKPGDTPIRVGDEFGNSFLGEFDDQFHVDLQHNRSGVLSMAKGGDDTGDSQFFVTERPTRDLDFNHTVFGQLVEGDAVREALSNLPTEDDVATDVEGLVLDDVPKVDAVITSVDIFYDEENGVLMLSAAEGASGQADIEITVADDDGNLFVQTFHVEVEQDSENGGPFLEDLPTAFETLPGTPIDIPLAAIDVEGDPLYFDALQAGSVAFTFEIDHDTGLTKVTPPDGFTGTLELLVGVTARDGSDTRDTWDAQTITIQVPPPAAPTTIDLLPGSDTGIDDQDNLTRLTTLEFEVEGVHDGALVTVYSGSVAIGTQTATSDSVIVTANIATFSDGAHAITATHSIGGVESDRSPELAVTADTTADGFTTTAPSYVDVGDTYLYNVGHEEETVGAQNLAYGLKDGPDGMQIDRNTGQIIWATSILDVKDHNVVVQATDLAGNVGEQRFVVRVNAAPQIGSVGPLLIDEGKMFALPIPVSDLNLPNESLTFALEGSVPDGASIDPSSGLLEWTPSEAQGPGAFEITVRVTDAGGLTATSVLPIEVAEVDRPPILRPIANRDVAAGKTLAFTAVANDNDIPPQAVTYSLDPGAPVGATIDPATGQFSWTPPKGTLGSFAITVRATNVSAASLSSSVTFRVRVGGTVSDIGFGIDLAIRSTQISLPAAGPFSLFGATAPPQVALPRIVRSPGVAVARGDVVQSRRELRDVGAGGGDVSVVQKELARQPGATKDANVVPAQYPEEQDEPGKKGTEADGPEADPSPDHSSTNPGSSAEVVDKAIAELLRELAR